VKRKLRERLNKNHSSRRPLKPSPEIVCVNFRSKTSPKKPRPDFSSGRRSFWSVLACPLFRIRFLRPTEFFVAH